MSSPSTTASRPPRRRRTSAGRLPVAADAGGGRGPQGAGGAAGGGTGPGSAGGGGNGEGGPHGVRFFTSEFEGVAGQVDWTTVGGNLREMVGTLVEGMPAILRGQPLPEGLSARIRQLNSPVLAATILVRDQFPGKGVVGTFTSAPFVVNAVAAALESAGMPLDDSQSAKILALARDNMAEDTRRLAGYGEAPWALAQLLDEVELKDRFFGDLFAVLTPAQTAVLRPESTRDRVRLDIFSSGLLFAGRLDVLPFKDEADLANRVWERAAKGLGCTPDQKAAIEGTFHRWTAGLPRSLLFDRVDLLDSKGLVTSARAAAWARQFLALFQTLAEEPTFVPKQRDAIRGIANVIVPLSADGLAAAK